MKPRVFPAKSFTGTLSFAVNVFHHDVGIAAAVRQRQRSYARSSVKMNAEKIREWSPMRPLWNNLCAILSPVL
jgi:hypothetical protein